MSGRCCKLPPPTPRWRAAPRLHTRPAQRGGPAAASKATPRRFRNKTEDKSSPDAGYNRAPDSRAKHNGEGEREPQRMQDLYVADLDLTRDFDDEAPADAPATRMSVPAFDRHPVADAFSRDGARRSNGAASGGGVAAAAENGAGSALAVRRTKELQMELSDTQTQLVAAESRNEELSMQVAEKERALQATKGDLIDTKLELQRSETRLEEVQERLQAASAERGEYRANLVEAQAELQATRSDLVDWSEGLTDLKGAMAGLDKDLGSLLGDKQYSEAVGEAMALAERMGGEGMDAAVSSRRAEEAAQAEATVEALKDLVQLSSDVLRQAQEDQQLFKD